MRKIYKNILLLGSLAAAFTMIGALGAAGTVKAEENTLTVNLNGGFIVENSVCGTSDFSVSYSGNSIELTRENVVNLFKNGENARFVYGLAEENFRGKTPALVFHQTGVVNISGESVAVNGDGTYLPLANKVLPGGTLFGLFYDENGNGIPDENEVLYRRGDVMPIRSGTTISCYYETNMYFRPLSSDIRGEVELVDGFIEKPTENIDTISARDLQPLQNDLVKIGNAAFNEPGKKIDYIELPDTVTMIGDRVFRNTSAKKVYGLERVTSFGDTTMYNTAAPTEPLVLSENVSGIYRDSLYWSNAKEVVTIIFTGDVAAQGYDGDTYTFLCRDGLSRTNPLGNMKQYVYVPYGQTKNYYPTYETYVATMRKSGHEHSGNANAQSEWRFNTDSSRDYLKMREYHVISFDLNGGNIDGKTELPITRMDARAVSVMGRTFDSETKTELNLREEDEVLRKDKDTIAATYTLPNVAAQDLRALKATKPENPVKEGKVFVGWQDENGVLWTDEEWERGGRSDVSYGATVKLTAKWADPVTVKIVSNTNQTYSDIQSYVGAKLSAKILPDPNPINYKVFDGWYTSADFSGEIWDFSVNEVAADTTLYAKWKNATFNAQLHVNGGYINGKTSEYFVYAPFVYGEGAQIPVPERNGYNFGGWFENDAFSGEPVTNFSKTSATLIYYAKWESANIVKRIDYILDGGENSSDNPSEYTVGGKVYFSDAVKKGCRFEGWYPNSQFVYEERVTMIGSDSAEDIVLYAKFVALKKYTVTYIDGGENGNAECFYEGETFLLSNPAKKGYTFAGWYEYSDFYGEPIIALFGNTETTEITLYAKWNATKTSKIKYETNGADLSESAQSKYKHGEIYYLPVPVKGGYRFIGWYTSADYTEGTEISYIGSDVTEDITVYARFEKMKNDAGKTPENDKKSYGGLVVAGLLSFIAVTIIGTCALVTVSKMRTKKQSGRK